MIFPSIILSQALSKFRGYLRRRGNVLSTYTKSTRRYERNLRSDVKYHFAIDMASLQA